MAALNVSLCSTMTSRTFDSSDSRLPKLRSIGSVDAPNRRRPSLVFHEKQAWKIDIPTGLVSAIGESIAGAGVVGLLAASLCFADPAMAYKANLTNANLEGSVTTGNTSFKGSIITGADFTDLHLRDDQRAYLCEVVDGINPTTGNSTKETLLC